VKPADDGTPIDESLAAFGGWTRKDEAVHKLISWTTFKDYPTQIGISLEVPDWVGSDTHEIQYWEEATFLPPISSAAEAYQWLMETLANRSNQRRLPRGMPPMFECIEVSTERTGPNGRILFSLDTSMVSTVQSMPNMVQIEYGSGYARVGMGDKYTIAMLKNEFYALIGDEWAVYPSLAYRRLRDETVRHHITTKFDEVKDALALNIGFDLPDKIQTDVGRGTEIGLRADQLRVLDHWAQANQTAMVGASMYLDNHTVEYWMPTTIDPIAEEN
jgi:hypothetical protein